MTAGQDPFLARVPVLDEFRRVADEDGYAALPDDWRIGVSDVVDSSGAIAAGRYKAVNLAGAGSISAVANALGGRLRLFAFGGDGAAFAIPPADAGAAADALARAATWARRDLGLDLRAGMTTVAAIRAAGHDVRAAFWRASDDVHYAMFAGGGVGWAEAELKRGALALPPAGPEDEPDLTGLSCRWGPIESTRGRILSLIVKPAPGAAPARFARVARRLVATLERAGGANPVPAEGPEVRWPPASMMAIHARIAERGRSRLRRGVSAVLFTVMAWLIFRLGLRVGGFDPARYRREVAANTDFRKFQDGLMMTVDCDERAEARLRALLHAAERAGVVRYGLHAQDEALMTCIVPSALTADHMHFIDGGGGGYASAARRMRGPGETAGAALPAEDRRGRAAAAHRAPRPAHDRPAGAAG